MIIFAIVCCCSFPFFLFRVPFCCLYPPRSFSISFINPPCLQFYPLFLFQSSCFSCPFLHRFLYYFLLFISPTCIHIFLSLYFLCVYLSSLPTTSLEFFLILNATPPSHLLFRIIRLSSSSSLLPPHPKLAGLKLSPARVTDGVQNISWVHCLPVYACSFAC